MVCHYYLAPPSPSALQDIEQAPTVTRNMQVPSGGRHWYASCMGCNIVAGGSVSGWVRPVCLCSSRHMIGGRIVAKS